MNEEDLREHFAQFRNKILNIRIPRDPKTYIGKGFAYIMFSSKELMKEAIEKTNGSLFKGRELRIKRAIDPKRLEKK